MSAFQGLRSYYASVAIFAFYRFVLLVIGRRILYRGLFYVHRIIRRGSRVEWAIICSLPSPYGSNTNNMQAFSFRSIVDFVVC